MGLAVLDYYNVFKGLFMFKKNSFFQFSTLLGLLLCSCEQNETTGTCKGDSCESEVCVNDTVLTCSCPMPEGRHLQIASPNGGETFRVGDIVQVAFCVDPKASNLEYIAETVSLSLSVDGGTNWGGISPLQLGSPNSRSWLVPETITIGSEEISTLSKDCLVRVVIYDSEGDPSVDFDTSDKTFSIIAVE